MNVRAFATISWLMIVLVMPLFLRGQGAKVVEQEGRVVITKVGTKPIPAQVGMGLIARDKLGTGESSRAVLQMSGKWFARVDEETDIEIMPGALNAKDKESLMLALGGAFIYSREEEGELKVMTPYATGGLRGTQLLVRVGSDGKTHMQVLEGEVDLTNDYGHLLLKSGEAGEAGQGQAPRRTAVIEARNLLQWALYYPAVLQLGELGLTDLEQSVLAPSLESYRSGDLLGALDRYPHDYAPVSVGSRLYHAAILLATGRVKASQQELRDVPEGHPGRRALELMLAAVKSEEITDTSEAISASEALAESYYEQSRSQLGRARDAAERATKLSPESGFAWTRLAEMEFSFGHIRAARQALERGLHFTPRNAQTHALRGFLQSAENQISAAQESFEEAVRLDGGLGSAWLGLGLVKIKQGQLAEGRGHLQTAATVEPTRSFYYSYHGKALNLEGRNVLAAKDLELAKQLDPNDPTPWLYSAIQSQQENRYNEAIMALNESLVLNDNRRVYRSQFLLDQDRAVRSSNLARFYQNNGMTELAVREATKAVESDYTNSSAHLFLANSFDALRDPSRISLRYETAWFNEQLLANLLAPVGGGPLSQYVSQQEYSKLLEADGFGGSSFTEWREHGHFEQKLSFYDTSGKLSTGLDFSYYDDEGSRLNGAELRKELYGQLKYQLSMHDTFYSLIKWQNGHSGDVSQSYDNVSSNPGLRIEESQEPGLLLVGWNHSWAPGVNTLFLGGRLADDLNISAPGTSQLLLQRNSGILQPGFLRPAAGGGLEYSAAGLRNATPPPLTTNPDGTMSASIDFLETISPFLGRGVVTGVYSDQFDFHTRRQFEILTAELQHIWQTSHNTLVIGGRWQVGPFETKTRLDLLNAGLAPLFTSPAALQNMSVDFERQSLYAYDFYKPTTWLSIIAGGSFDDIARPDNFRNPPINNRKVDVDKYSTKLGFTLSPAHWVTIRGVYTESLGGVSFDESVRLEPVQIAGFNQAFRTVISESLVGSVETPIYKNRGLLVEGVLPTRTWWSMSYNLLDESVERTVGAFDILSAPVFPYGLAILPAGTSESLDYREEVYASFINQLIGREFAVGTGYRRTNAELRDVFPQIPVALASTADRLDEATLHELVVNANWNSPTGWFARAEANRYSQDLHARVGGQPVATPPGDDFWQLNIQVGFRFHQNQREISVGLLNLMDRDYHLSTLTYTPNLPRMRTFYIRCRVNL